MQSDGNLFVYSPASKTLFAIGTTGSGGTRLVLQTDGNIVIYTASNRAV